MAKQAPSATDVTQRCSSERGVALLLAVLILFVVSVLGATVVQLGGVDYALSGNYRANTVAFHLAESGMQTAAADLLADYSADPSNNWLRDWVDTSGGATVRDPFPDPADTVINGHSLTATTTSPNPYAGLPYSLGGTAALGAGEYERLVWLPPVVVSSDGVDTLEFRLRSIGTDPSRETPATVMIDGVLVVELGDNGGIRAGVSLGDGDGGDVLKGNNLHIAGSVIVLGDGDTRVKLLGRSSIVNNYSGIDDLADGLGTLATKLPALDAADFNGETVETLDAFVRIKDARLQMGGNASIGAADATGNALKETVDSLYSDDLPGANRDLFADSVGPYDLGDEASFPSLYAPYVDDQGAGHASFADYLSSQAYTPGLGGDLIIDGDTSSFSYVDPGGRGSISWDRSSLLLTVDGIVKVNGQAKLGKTGEVEFEGGQYKGGVIPAIKYAGTGVLWSTDKIEIATDIYPQGRYLEDGPDLDGLVDGNLTLIASKEIEVQSGRDDPNVRIIAALFAEEKMVLKEPTNIAGSVTTNYMEAHGNDRVNVWHVPRLNGMAMLGSPAAATTLALSVSIRDWFQRR